MTESLLIFKEGDIVKMKRLLCALVMGCLLVAGISCAASAAPQRLIIATAGVSGSYYPFGGAVAKIWTEKLKDVVSVAAQATGGAVENTKLMEMGEVELALTQNDLAEYSWNAQYMFNKSYQKQRAIATLFPEVIHIFALRSSGIESFSDLKGKKISMSQQGSGGLVNSEQILGHFGITKADVDPLYLSNVDAVDRMKDELLDAIFVTTGSPNATYQDLCFAKDVRLLGIPEKDIEELVKEYPFYSKYIIPKSTYDKQTDDTATVTVQAVLIASIDLGEDLVYQLTKTLWENQKDLTAAMAKAQFMDPENPFKSVTIPLHPGAEKYYKEIGILK